jgi:hypothetical protein
LITDITVLYFIGGVFAVVIGTIIARLLLWEQNVKCIVEYVVM